MFCIFSFRQQSSREKQIKLPIGSYNSPIVDLFVKTDLFNLNVCVLYIYMFQSKTDRCQSFRRLCLWAISFTASRMSESIWPCTSNFLSIRETRSMAFSTFI